MSEDNPRVLKVSKMDLGVTALDFGNRQHEVSGTYTAVEKLSETHTPATGETRINLELTRPDGVKVYKSIKK